MLRRAACCRIVSSRCAVQCSSQHRPVRRDSSTVLRRSSPSMLLPRLMCSSAAEPMSQPTVPCSSPPTLRRRCTNPYPKELRRPVSELPHCADCEKHFATEAALANHLARTCGHPFQCAVCFMKIASQSNLTEHMELHSANRPTFTCLTCGGVFLSESALRMHRLKYPGDHGLTDAPRPLKISRELLTDGSFAGHDHVLEDSMHHSTMHRLQPIIEQDGRVQGRKNASMVLDSVLLNADAPDCAHFKLTSESHGAFDISTFVPSRAEPGELGARLVTKIPQSWSKNPEKYGVYLVSLGKESHLGRAKRATVLVCERKWWPWADKHCIPLDMRNNPIFSFDAETQRFRIATEFVDHGQLEALLPTPEEVASEEAEESSESRGTFDNSSRSHGALGEPALELDESPEEPTTSRLTVTVVVADGFNFRDDSASHRWDRVFRVHREGEKVFCPLCERQFPNYIQLFEHERIEHQGGQYICHDATCDLTFNTARALRVHLDAHAGRYFKCWPCNRTFKWKGSLTRHMARHHADQEDTSTNSDTFAEAVLPPLDSTVDRAFRCAHCASEFATRRHTREHARLHHRGVYLWCHLPTCGAQFSYPSNLRDHIDKAHSKRDFFEIGDAPALGGRRRELFAS